MKKWNPDPVEFTKLWNDQDLTVKDIGKFYHRDSSRITEKAKELKLHSRNRGRKRTYSTELTDGEWVYTNGIARWVPYSNTA